MTAALLKSSRLIFLAFVIGNARAFDEGSFDMLTTDYHTDENRDIAILGASAYFGLDRSLQEKFSVQLISQDDAPDEAHLFWAVATSGRFSPGGPVRPFAGLGVSFGESYVCRDDSESDDVHVYHNGEEVCLADTLVTVFGEYGVYWLMNDRVFLEISGKRNRSTKYKYPFDSTLKGLSFGIRY